MYLVELNKQAFQALQYSPSLNYIFSKIVGFFCFRLQADILFYAFRHGSFAYIMYTSNSNPGVQ